VKQRQYLGSLPLLNPPALLLHAVQLFSRPAAVKSDAVLLPAAAAAAVPSWVGEWRLQLALRSAGCFQVSRAEHSEVV
jgi:hypothetical protein